MQSSRYIIRYVFFPGNVLPLTWVRVILDLSNPCRDKRLEAAGRTLNPGKGDTAVSEEFDIGKLNRTLFLYRYREAEGEKGCRRGIWVALGAGCHSRLSCNEVYFIGALFRFFGGCTRRRQMLLAGRLKRHTLPVILEFRVEPSSLEANLFKLLHFCEEELDPPFLYIIIPVKTNLPQLFQTTATRSLMIRVLLFTERAFRRQKCTGRIVGVFLLSMGLRDIFVRLLWFEQLDVFLEYANFDRELGWETKVWILYE